MSEHVSDGRRHGKSYAVDMLAGYVGAAELADKSLVYIVEAGPFVKIGHSTNVSRRIEAIQEHCPYPATVVAVMKGGRAAEAQLHKAYRNRRARGEWFHKDGILPDLMEIADMPQYRVEGGPPKKRRRRALTLH